jgi:hypothetical protein
MNPFSPTFGKNPPQLIGRSHILADFAESLDAASGDERRASFYTGLRGMGKTVLLNKIGEEARGKGWIVAEVSVTATMLNDILDQVIDQTRKIVKYKERDITGFDFSLFGIGIGVSGTVRNLDDYGWRMKMTKILEELQKKNIGVLFTVDEVWSDSEPLRELSTAYQHFVREDRPVAIAMAGLPYEVSDLLNDRALTFLRRANKVTLTSVGIDEVSYGLLHTIEKNGRVIGFGALKKAAEATYGYPYLIQLVGSRIWDVHDQQQEITDGDVEIGVTSAIRKLFENVISPMLNELSAKDIEFLKAMSADADQTAIADLTVRLNASQSYVSQYRKRLLDADLIFAPRRGVVAYAMPFMREYLTKPD